MTEPQVSPDNGWFDGPRPGPYATRPMEQLLHELAQRTGRPILPIRPLTSSANGKKGGYVPAQRRRQQKQEASAPAPHAPPAACSSCGGWPARADSGLCERHHALARHRGAA